eukprot:9409-Heterococcus_DN1.PRE.3
MLSSAHGNSDAATEAAYAGHQRGFLTSTALLTQTLDVDACHNKLAAAQWLREQGAEWPTALSLRYWKGEVLAWARAEGCTTPISN